MQRFYEGRPMLLLLILCRLLKGSILCRLKGPRRIRYIDQLNVELYHGFVTVDRKWLKNQGERLHRIYRKQSTGSVDAKITIKTIWRMRVALSHHCQRAKSIRRTHGTKLLAQSKRNRKGCGRLTRNLLKALSLTVTTRKISGDQRNKMLLESF